MTLKPQTINNLVDNWPYAADMATFVEARIYDPASIAEWYLIALDPDDLNRACAIVVTDTLEMDYVDIAELIASFEAMGKELVFDEHFRREKCMKVWSKLMRKMRGDIDATV